MASILPTNTNSTVGTTPPVVSAPGTAQATGTDSATGSVVDNTTLASNFTTFLTLLTTQLKNQNPLDPLDTNQFTQQLVQFAQVEQQLKSNDSLSMLVTLQKTQQSTAALDYVGKTVAVDGTTAQLADGSANWSFNAPKTATATVNIQNSTGQVVFSSKYTVNPGLQQFTWDGRDTNGNQWPDGNYTMNITATDPNGQAVAISPEVQGTVDSADLTKDPPALTIAGQTFTLDKIKRVIRSS
jgi:flagellar basal-body rod modification protein FlgD